MIIENLEKEHLVRIANVFEQNDWTLWHDISHKWNGFDLIGGDYIFQLSYEGTIHIYLKEIVTKVELDIDQEDKIRKVLNEILRNK